MDTNENKRNATASGCTEENILDAKSGTVTNEWGGTTGWDEKWNAADSMLGTLAARLCLDLQEEGVSCECDYVRYNPSMETWAGDKHWFSESPICQTFGAQVDRDWKPGDVHVYFAPTDNISELCTVFANSYCTSLAEENLVSHVIELPGLSMPTWGCPSMTIWVMGIEAEGHEGERRTFVAKVPKDAVPGGFYTSIEQDGGAKAVDWLLDLIEHPCAIEGIACMVEGDELASKQKYCGQTWVTFDYDACRPYAVEQ